MSKLTSAEVVCPAALLLPILPSLPLIMMLVFVLIAFNLQVMNSIFGMLTPQQSRTLHSKKLNCVLQKYVLLVAQTAAESKLF